MPRLIIRMIVIVGLAMGCAIAGAGVEMRAPDLNADLARLCYSGSADAIAAALRDGRLTVNARDERGHSPLHLAVTANHDLDAVTVLLDAGADVDARDGAGYTALFSALLRERGGPEFAQALLARGANPNRADQQGLAPLHFAVARGAREPALVAVLLKAGANPNLADAQGATPLHVASDARTVRALLAAGADPGLRDRQGRTAFLTRKDSEALVALVLEAHANPNAVDREGRTALHLAVWGGAAPDHPAPAAVEALLALGVDGQARDHQGRTALDLARANPQASDAVTLIEQAVGTRLRDDELRVVLHGSPAQLLAMVRERPGVLSAGDAFGFRALHLAARFNDAQAVAALLGAGARVEVAGENGQTPLLFALNPAWRPNAQADAIVALLLAAGADAGARDAWGRTALHFAVQGKNAHVIERLIAAGAQPGVRDVEGDSALDLAASVGDAAMLKAMAGAALRPDERNRAGMTPLMLAITRNPDPGAARALLALGAGTELRTTRGETALVLAALHTVHGATPDREAELVAALLAAHADPNVRCGVDRFDLKSMPAMPGAQPKFAALPRWNWRTLVDAYADGAAVAPVPNLPSSNAGWCEAGTPLVRAASAGTAALLRAAGAN